MKQSKLETDKTNGQNEMLSGEGLSLKGQSRNTGMNKRDFIFTNDDVTMVTEDEPKVGMTMDEFREYIRPLNKRRKLELLDVIIILQKRFGVYQGRCDKFRPKKDKKKKY